MTEARSEDSYIIHDIITAFAHYGYPQPPDPQNLKIKGDVPIRVGSKTYSPDVIYYAGGIPLLLVGSKRLGKSAEDAKQQEFSYIKNFPVESYSRGRIRPKYLAITVGPQIEGIYKYIYEIDDRGELIEDLEKLSGIPTYEELKKQYGIVEEEKPQLTPDSFKDLFYELASALDISEENKITPELILKVVCLIYEYLKDSQNYVSRVPYVQLDGHPDRQQWMRNILSQYSWQGSLGSDLASQFRIEILRSFQGADLNQYITPKSVVDFMVGLCEVSPEDKVLDFECGSGSFIAAAISQGVPMENVLGVDINPLPYYVAKTYLALHFGVTGKAVENIPVVKDNGLYFWNDNWDVVIGNPAGGSQYDPQGELNDLEKVLENLERDLDQNGRDDPFSEYNFSVQQAVRSCKVGGKICLILPEGFFANSTDEFLRRYVAKHCKIKAIISLPRGVFRKGTTTKTVMSGSQTSSQKMSILFAEKTKEVEDSFGLDIDAEQLDYSVFLTSVQKPESVGSDPDEWLEPLLGKVFEEWKVWKESKTLSSEEAPLDIVESDAEKKEKLVKFQKARQEHLIKPEAPLLDMADQPKPKPKTEKETVIPENLEELFG